MMEEIVPVSELAIGTKIFAFGAGMSEQVFCITEPKDSNGAQEMCLVSNYYGEAYFSPRSKFDKYSRPVSAKFGIGYYWDDVENVVFPESTVKAAIRRANYLEKKIAKKEAEIKAADKKECEELPARYPHLKVINKEFSGYNAQKSNVVAELKYRFPNTKFSVRKDGYDCIRIDWTDGPSYDEVRKVAGKFVDHETDFTGDFRDYSPSNFNHIFGGFNYIFETREMSDEIRVLADTLRAEINYSRSYDADTDLHTIFSRTEIPTGAKNFRLEKVDIEFGSIADSYKIAFDLEKTETKSVEAISDDIEVFDYSPKSFVVKGNTKPIKDQLRSLGGSFNMYLRRENEVFAGWIFPLTKKQAVLSALKV